MCLNKANYIQVAYASSEERADKALAVKAARLGLYQTLFSYS
jgi:hypothetical protein